MSHKLCVIAGDGIGSEVTSAAIKVLHSIDGDIEIVEADAGWQTFCETGRSVPEETLRAVDDCGSALFGAVSSPSRQVDGYRSAILTLRQELKLNANLRPIKSSWCDDHRSRKIDLLIVRENSEGLYIGRERREGENAIAEKLVTRHASERIGSWAARIAAARSGEVMIVHKANVLPVSQGLFRDSVRKSIDHWNQQSPGGSSPDKGSAVTVSESLVDIVAHNLVALPESFDVLVTTNMFGDILSDLAAYWCGGMGRAPSLNVGDSLALAEPVHGSAPDIAGLGVADPTATILSLSLLARYHWGDDQLANEIEQVVIRTVQELATAEFKTDEFVATAIRTQAAHQIE